MINKHELRIGNIVKYGELWREVTLLSDNVKVGIDAIITLYKVIEPIPLTEEVLEQCNEAQCLSIRDFIVIIRNKTAYSIVIKNTEMQLLFLHQLQNLYYCLAGEELNIEIKEK